MFELYTRYTYTMQDAISEAGITLIKRFVDSQNPQSEEWLALNASYTRRYMPFIPSEWEWKWKVAGKAEYTGTFPKRLTNYFWKECGLKCPDSFTKELGNLARQHSHESLTYSFELVNRIDWQDGDYGDSNSCFWSDRQQALKMLEQNDALAIRFYNGEQGIARAWIAQLSESRYILFNGYGIETIKIAQIFSAWLKLTYKKISLYNHGETSGSLYINNGGYLIGTLEQCAAMSSHDLYYNCDDCYTCDNCGNEISEDEGYATPNGEVYCSSCFYDNYDDCAHCGEAAYREDMTYVESMGDVCERCLDRHYFLCDSCHEYRANRNFIEGKDYCMICKPLPDDSAGDA